MTQVCSGYPLYSSVDYTVDFSCVRMFACCISHSVMIFIETSKPNSDESHYGTGYATRKRSNTTEVDCTLVNRAGLFAGVRL